MATQVTSWLGRQLGQGIVARRVERVAVIPQLDHHPVAPEQFDQPLQLLGRCRRTVIDDHQEVAGEPEMLDDIELVIDGAPRPGAQRHVFVGRRSLAVPVAATLFDEMT